MLTAESLPRKPNDMIIVLALHPTQLHRLIVAFAFTDTLSIPKFEEFPHAFSLRRISLYILKYKRVIPLKPVAVLKKMLLTVFSWGIASQDS